MYSSIQRAHDFYQRFNQDDFWENVVCAADELKGDRISSGQQIGFSSKDELRDTKNLLKDLKVQIAFKHSILQAILTESLSMQQQHHDLVYSYADKSCVKPKNHLTQYVQQEIDKFSQILNSFKEKRAKPINEQNEDTFKPNIVSPFKSSGISLIKCSKLQQVYWKKSGVYGQKSFANLSGSGIPEKNKLLEVLFGGNLLSYWLGRNIQTLSQVTELAGAEFQKSQSSIGRSLEPQTLPVSPHSFFLTRQINAFTLQLIRAFLGLKNDQNEENQQIFGSNAPIEALKYVQTRLGVTQYQKQTQELVEDKMKNQMAFVDVDGIDMAFIRPVSQQVIAPAVMQQAAPIPMKMPSVSPTTPIAQQRQGSGYLGAPRPSGLPGAPGIGPKPAGLGIAPPAPSLGLAQRGPLSLARPVGQNPTSIPQPVPLQANQASIQASITTTNQTVPRLESVTLMLGCESRINSSESQASAVSLASLTMASIAQKTASQPQTLPKSISAPSSGILNSSIGIGCQKPVIPTIGLSSASGPSGLGAIARPAIAPQQSIENTSQQSLSTLRTATGPISSTKRDFSTLLAKIDDAHNLTQRQLKEFLPLFQTFYCLQRQFLMVLYKINGLSQKTTEGIQKIQESLHEVSKAFTGQQGDFLKKMFETEMVRTQIDNRFRQLKSVVI